MDIFKVIENLQDWKNLPAYRAEPRVDFVVAAALPELLRVKYGCGCEVIIPELPIRIGTIRPAEKTDKSYKVDFYAYLENGQHIFIEFKTDTGSRRPEQDKYLREAQAANMQAILEGIIKIADVTDQRYKHKYDYLLKKLAKHGLLIFNGNNYTPSLKMNEIELLYIQPKAEKPNAIGFVELSSLMSQSTDPVYQKFAELIKSWAE